MTSGFDWDSVLQYVSSAATDLSSSQPECATTETASVSSRAQCDDIPQQLPTPPYSDYNSPQSDEQEDASDTRDPTLSVSSTFHPAAALLNTVPDLILLSFDGVFFYVHATRLLTVSSNQFGGYVTPPGTGTCDDFCPIVPLPQEAAVLNIVLHAVYGLSCAHYLPGVDTLVAAVDAMAAYGLALSAHITPSTPLYSLLLGQSPMKPIDVYALAGAHNLHDLAVPVSSHLLSFLPQTLSDELAVRMGSIYVKRLIFLHLGRIEALKRIIYPPPRPHPPTEQCDFVQQKKLARAWALSVGYLAWEPCADMTTSTIKGALCPLADHLSCDDCKQTLADRIKEVISQWSVVKRTI